MFDPKLTPDPGCITNCDLKLCLICMLAVFRYVIYRFETELMLNQNTVTSHFQCLMLNHNTVTNHFELKSQYHEILCFEFSILAQVTLTVSL